MAIGGVLKLNKKSYILVLLLFILLYFQYHRHYNRAEKINLLQILQASIHAAEEGGKLIVSTRNEFQVKSKGKTKEGLDNRVTTADLLSHCSMVHFIKSAFPTIRLVSEEKDVSCDSDNNLKIIKSSESQNIDIEDSSIGDVDASDVTVWIDPLDATHEYTEKLFQYVTTMVCVAVKGEPVIGVIHNPFIKSTSWAVVGRGHSNNLKQKVKSDTGQIKVIISRSHSGTIKDVLSRSCPKCELEIAAGAGYKSLKVAQGEVDAYLHITAIQKWDICAGHAIIKALGGQMTTKYGKPLTYYNDSDVVNDDGLIATLQNHEYFLNKL